MAQIIEITDFTREELSPYVRLTEAQLRSKRDPSQALFIAESAKVISHALDAGYTPVSMLLERSKLPSIADTLLPRCGEIPVFTGNRELLAELTGFALTRGILCAMRRPAPMDAAAICKDARRIAVLEGIVDPTNVGAIFRSVRRRIGYGCGAAEPQLLRPAPPPGRPGEYGHGISGALGLSWGGYPHLAPGCIPYAQEFGLFHRRHGPGSPRRPHHRCRAEI